MTDQTESECSRFTTHTCVFVDVAPGNRVCISEQFSAELHQRLGSYLDTIRALEAKVREQNKVIFKAGQMVGEGMRDNAELRADRDRLAGEVDRLTKLAYDWKRKAEYLGKDRERLVLMNESLGDSLDAALKAGAEMGEELAKARENEARYLVVRNATPAEADTFNTVKTAEQFDQAADAIIAARRAGEGEK